MLSKQPLPALAVLPSVVHALAGTQHFPKPASTFCWRAGFAVTLRCLTRTLPCLKQSPKPLSYQPCAVSTCMLYLSTLYVFVPTTPSRVPLSAPQCVTQAKVLRTLQPEHHVYNKRLELAQIAALHAIL